MAQTLVASSSLSDIADAIREKNGTSTLYKPREMGDAVRDIKIYNEVINSFIGRYKAQADTVSANTFVEFVNGATSGVDTTLTDTPYSSYHSKAILMDENKVFISHEGTVTNYLYGMVCTISGTTITAGTDTVLVNSASNVSTTFDSAVKIDTDKVFIAHSSNSGYLNGVVCTISGTTITAGTDTTLVNSSGAYKYASAALIDTNKVFIAYSNNNTNYYLNGVVCTISGTTITAGTKTSIVNTSNSSYYASSVGINNGYVFIAHRGGNYLNGIACEIIGTNIYPKTDTVLVGEADSYKYALAIQTNWNGWSGSIYGTSNIFVSHKINSVDNYINGMVCTIQITQAGASIVPGADVTIIDSRYIHLSEQSSIINIALMDTNKVFITYLGDTNIQGRICTILGSVPTPSNDISIVSYYSTISDFSLASLDTGRFFVSHRSNNNEKLNGIICEINNVVKPSETKIEGLTKTECTTSVAGDVWILRKIFSFFIGEDEYSSYENMTWGEWISSDFNTNGFYVGEIYDGTYAVKRNDASGEYEYYYLDDTMCDTQIEVKNLVIVEDSYVESGIST